MNPRRWLGLAAILGAALLAGGYYLGLVLPNQRHVSELELLDRWFY